MFHIGLLTIELRKYTHLSWFIFRIQKSNILFNGAILPFVILNSFQCLVERSNFNGPIIDTRIPYDSSNREFGTPVLLAAWFRDWERTSCCK